MRKALREVFTIAILAALIGTPIGLHMTGVVKPVAQWGSNGE